MLLGLETTRCHSGPMKATLPRAFSLLKGLVALLVAPLRGWREKGEFGTSTGKTCACREKTLASHQRSHIVKHNGMAHAACHSSGKLCNLIMNVG